MSSKVNGETEPPWMWPCPGNRSNVGVAVAVESSSTAVSGDQSIVLSSVIVEVKSNCIGPGTKPLVNSGIGVGLNEGVRIEVKSAATAVTVGLGVGVTAIDWFQSLVSSNIGVNVDDGVIVGGEAISDDTVGGGVGVTSSNESKWKTPFCKPISDEEPGTWLV